MAKPKKKLLPKNFEELLKAGEIDVLKAVFETCEVNARGGATKRTALAFNDCPDELARWLIDNGADISAEDKYGETPLHSRSRHWQGHIEILLELGADVTSGENGPGTPLHFAAAAGNIDTSRILLLHGANARALNSAAQTPLAYALQNCSNANLAKIADIATLLLDAEPPALAKPAGLLSKIFGKRANQQSGSTDQMKAMVRRIGENFEFHRENFNPDSVEEASAALDRLYSLFDVTPVPRRNMHDGKSPIIPSSHGWQNQHQELWDLLVPSSGAADTIQGEVIRIAGKIRRELEGNGGVNWDADYKIMSEAFLDLVGRGTPLPDGDLVETAAIVKAVKARHGDIDRLCEIAVEWVKLNPAPLVLPTPKYDR